MGISGKINLENSNNDVFKSIKYAPNKFLIVENCVENF